MFKTLVILSLTLCLLNPLSANNNGLTDSVQSSKHIIGIQLNPRLGDYRFDPISNIYTLNSALRYGYNFKPTVTAGAEFLFSTSQNYIGNTYAMGPGIYGRYWFLKNSWIGLGAEVNGFLVAQKYVDNPENDWHGEEIVEKVYADKYKFSYFVSPVITLKKPGSRWSLDLMYKFTHISIPAYNNEPVFTYRLNFNF